MTPTASAAPDSNALNLDSLLSGLELDDSRYNEEMSYEQYLAHVLNDPRIVRNAYQRMYDMIISKGTESFTQYRQTLTTYKFFSDPEIPIFGLEETLHKLVQFLKGAAGGFGPEHRILLLHGPVGSSKSTICRLLKKGLERYSRTNEGRWYTYKFVDLPLPDKDDEGVYTHSESECPLFEDPLTILPQEVRQAFLEKVNQRHFDSLPESERKTAYTLSVDGDPNPRSKLFLRELVKRNNGSLQEVLKKHVRVIRKVFSEVDRVGIGTFQPKDEKNQDATELSGDINFREMAFYGKDSDPRAFNYDGEFCVSNRGVFEVIEMLKLAQEFLYDFLSASQEKSVKPKKAPQMHIDQVLIGHTNGPEYDKLVENKGMEALRDRTYKIDVPYLLSWSKETKILESKFGGGRVKQHVAPHTFRIAALWSVLTRLVRDTDVKLSMVDKAKLYDGMHIAGYNEDMVKEIRDRHYTEGMKQGVSIRYVEDKISNTLASRYNYINPFMVIDELSKGLENYSLINNEDDRKHYKLCMEAVRMELDEILKEEVQQAMIGNSEAMQDLCSNYIDHLFAYIRGTKVKNKYTQMEIAPDERLMREIEGFINVPEKNAHDFRMMIAAKFGDMLKDGRSFQWDSDQKLAEAIKKKLFSDVRDGVKLSALSAVVAVVNPENKEKINNIKSVLINRFGYNEESATDVLEHVGSIFSRGEKIA